MIGDRKILAVITARAGSVGVVGKNYKPLLGKPLVIWSVEAAFRSKYVDSIFVSTNCPHVKQAVSEWIGTKKEDGSHVQKVIIIDRPEELSGPKSKNEEALLHAVQMYEDKFNNSPDIVANLQPTSPVRRKDLLDDALERLDDNGGKSLLTVSQHTPLFIQPKNGSLHWYYDRLNRPMRQSLSESDYFYHDDGCLYLTDTQVLFNEMCRLDDNPFLYVNDPYSSLQIDSEEDFRIVESVLKEIHASGRYI